MALSWHAAAWRGDMEELSALAEKLRKARDSNDPFSLLTLGDPLNELDETDAVSPIFHAVHQRHPAAVRLLLSLGADPNLRCNGKTPLHVAVLLGCFTRWRDVAKDIVSVLLEHNADAAVKDDCGETALHTASGSGWEAGLSALATACPRAVEARDRLGRRPLHVAAAAGHARAAAILVKMGAGLDHRTGLGDTPLHLAAAGGHAEVQQVLEEAGADATATNKRGLTPAQAAVKARPMPRTKADTAEEVKAKQAGQEVGKTRGRDPEDKGKDLTLLVSHPLCLEHHTCHPLLRGVQHDRQLPPENVERVRVLVDDELGVLRTANLARHTVWDMAPPRAAIADVLRVHDFSYVNALRQRCGALVGGPATADVRGDQAKNKLGTATQAEEHVRPDDRSQHKDDVEEKEMKMASLDGDTVVSPKSFEAAMHAAGAACRAVDAVVSGEVRNAFCAVRPPGHHAGVRGLVEGGEDNHGSSGFCLLNNVAIAAAYARHVYRHRGVRRVAIVDFDVHHGNGTEDVIRSLAPREEEFKLETPVATVVLRRDLYKPWLDERDPEEVLFVSTHGYGRKGTAASAPWFYPASGRTSVCDVSSPVPGQHQDIGAGVHAGAVATEKGGEGGEGGEGVRRQLAQVLDVGLGQGGRLEWRDAFRLVILPRLLAFRADLILISAGFDAHKRDSMGCGFIGLLEDDYAWVTRQIVAVANRCCEGRVVSMLEGGYNIQGGAASVFASSVVAHVQALATGAQLREEWDELDARWESDHENSLAREREKRRAEKEDLERTKVAQALEEQAQQDPTIKEALEEYAGNGNGVFLFSLSPGMPQGGHLALHDLRASCVAEICAGSQEVRGHEANYYRPSSLPSVVAHSHRCAHAYLVSERLNMAAFW